VYIVCTSAVPLNRNTAYRKEGPPYTNETSYDLMFLCSSASCMVWLVENPPPPHRPVGTCTARLSMLEPVFFCPCHLKTCLAFRYVSCVPDFASTSWVPSANCRTRRTSLPLTFSFSCRAAVSAPASMWVPLRPSASPSHVTVLESCAKCCTLIVSENINDADCLS
jgi:hypothetical protein